MKRPFGPILPVTIAIFCVSCSSGTPGSSPFPAISGDLSAVVAGFSLSPEGSNAYVPPTDAERETYRSALSNLLDGDTESALEGLESLGMEIVDFTDVTGPTFILIRENQSPLRGWGLYAINTSALRNLLLEAPHPGADLGTETQAAGLFLDVSARGLLIAGTHRCASPDASPCTGTTSVCSASSADEPFRVSDTAHDAGQIFQITHEVLLNSDFSLKAVALHGFEREEGDPHAFVSNGTDKPFNAEALANRFAARLNEITSLTDAARSCNDAGSSARLCGTHDVQGRYANGSADACTGEAPGATGRFLHVEQSLDLRTGGGEVDPSSVRLVLEEFF